MRVAVGLDLALGEYDWLLDRATTLANLLEARLDLVWVGEGEERRATLDALMETVPRDLRGDCRILHGDPADALIALTHEVDAIVIGPRQPPGFERFYLHPMAVRVLRRTQCPVYVPRCDRLGNGRPRMIAGVDLRSDRLDWFLEHTNAWARMLDGVVDLVHAIPGSLPPVRRPELREGVMRSWREARADVLTEVEALLGRLDAPLRGVATLAPGEAEDVLVDASSKHDLIVVGNRDRKGLERFLLGGVARIVAVRATCDVLILPTAKSDEIVEP